MRRFRHIPILVWLSLFVLGGLTHAVAQHPSLLFSQEAVRTMRAEYQQVPLFHAEVQMAQKRLAKAIAAGIDVPVPKDMAGGYTHEQHKQNWINMYDAGILYQITEKEDYAVFVRDMLLAYADLFPTLGLHPTNQSYATGKIFWQCLNDANWLVFTAQTYDCVYEFLSETERERLEGKLFRPMADWLSVENPQFFNRIHNHSTWGCAAVGMIALAMQDEELLQRALYGLPDSLAPDHGEDNDGGVIEGAGSGPRGFFAQLDGAFSPDGFFTEGPYYLRYALTPYLLSANALENATDSIKVLTYRDTLLKKAVYSLLYQTDANGWVFPINDAQKGMSWHAPSVISAVDIAYAQYGRDPRLLSVVEQQKRVSLDQAGFMAAKDLAEGKAVDWQRESAFYTDGPAGDMGGMSILRAGDDPAHRMALAYKYSAHGGGHGHYDRLSYSLYDSEGEVIQDYGAVRWVNIEQKGGGRYLPENKTWGKHTLAHNTLVVDQQSQNKGKVRVAERHAAKQVFAIQSTEGWEAVRVKDSLSYEGCTLDRTLMMVNDEESFPFLIDVFRVSSEQEHQYDLPLWYQGHFLETKNIRFHSVESPTPLGKRFGYEHVRLEAAGAAEASTATFSWFNGSRFTTLTTLTNASEDSLLWIRLGADDPQFNLRHDPALLIRKKGTHTLFFSVVEHHGGYEPAIEIPIQPYSRLKEIRKLRDDDSYTALEIRMLSGHSWLVFMANQASMSQPSHQLEIAGKTYEWEGPITLISAN